MPYILENRTMEGGYYTRLTNRDLQTLFALTYSPNNAQIFNETEKTEAEMIAKLLNMGGWDFILRKVVIDCRKTNIIRNHEKQKYEECKNCRYNIPQFGMCHKGYLNYYCKRLRKNGCKKVK